ncbi:non-ribosomal peptide synthetase, partial [Streptomyces sp. NPDC054864]
MTLLDVFGEWVSRSPGSAAVVCGGERLTYAGLDARAQEVARALRARGVTAGARVGICLPRGTEPVIALLGVLKAGAVAVPLDPEYPAERLTFMAADSGTQVVLASAATAPAVAGTGVPVALWENLGELPTEEHSPHASPAPAPVFGDSPAYVFYTSGSTGRPKGVILPHQGFVRAVRDPHFDIHPGDVVSQMSTLSFDAGALETWNALANGATLAISPERALSVQELGAFITDHSVSILWLTAGLFHAVIDADIHVLAPVRVVMSGGDALSPTHCRRVLDTLPSIRLVNAYGPTEVSITATSAVLDPTHNDTTLVRLGTATPDTHLMILDHQLQPAPPGTDGELYVTGIGLAHGYANRPALTAERFTASPTTPGTRIYRTGDLVRQLPNGDLQFLGRSDNQVKIRGYRIELGEIETALTRHPHVTQAITVIHTDPHGTKQLTAYAVTTNTDTTSNTLRQTLTDTLPDYMIPTTITTLDTLPLTPNGKVDRNALPKPTTTTTTPHGYTAPRTPHEQTLATAFADVLNLPHIGIHDHFFHHGGDSILAVRALARLTTNNITLTLRDLFEHPTIAELAHL